MLALCYRCRILSFFLSDHFVCFVSFHIRSFLTYFFVFSQIQPLARPNFSSSVLVCVFFLFPMKLYTIKDIFALSNDFDRIIWIRTRNLLNFMQHFFYKITIHECDVAVHLRHLYQCNSLKIDLIFIFTYHHAKIVIFILNDYNEIEHSWFGEEKKAHKRYYTCFIFLNLMTHTNTH